MATATNVTKLNTTEDVVTTEIFGDNISTEKTRAKNALKDFARWYPNIKKDYKILEAQLDACTQKGQVASVMAKIRRTYM